MSKTAVRQIQRQTERNKNRLEVENQSLFNFSVVVPDTEGNRSFPDSCDPLVRDINTTNKTKTKETGRKHSQTFH